MTRWSFLPAATLGERSRRMGFREIALLLAVVAVVSGVSIERPGATRQDAVTVANSGVIPTGSAVRHGRFVETVELDGGLLRVEPPSKRDVPAIGERTAEADIWANPALLAMRRIALGFGLVTISSTVGIKPMRKLEAWVGFGRPAHQEACPSAPSGAARESASSGYIAVIMGAGDGKPSADYGAAAGACGTTPDPAIAIAPARMEVSLRWRYLGSAEIAVSLPRCGVSLGTNRVSSEKAPTMEAIAEVPLPGCSAVKQVREEIQPNSLALIGSRLHHAPLGPVSQPVG